MVGKAGRSIKVAVTDRITIFGYGRVGRATAARLMAEGREVIIAQRRAPPDLPKGATFAPSDALDRDAVVKAVRGAGQLVVAVGFAYSGVVWREAWPKAMANFVAACKATGARMVFIDNLYMYGPQSRPLVETMPLSDTGWKPAARSAATRIWMDGRRRGRSPGHRAARARLLWARRRQLLSRRHVNRQACPGQTGRVHRLPGRAARLRLRA